MQADFSLTEATNLINVTAPGATGTLSLTISALDGFTGAVNFAATSCSGLPAVASCSFLPATVNGSGATTLTVTTTAGTAAQMHRDSFPLLTAFGGLMAGCVLLRFRRRPGMRVFECRTARSTFSYAWLWRWGK